MNSVSQTGQFKYEKDLQKSFLFYEANRSGFFPDDNRIKWRGDSAIKDGRKVRVDLTSGYYDAGDRLKFDLPLTSSMYENYSGELLSDRTLAAVPEIKIAKNITGTSDNDFLIGFEGNDTITGNSGDDRIEGKEGNDIISGQLGDDSLEGGAGDDRLYGKHNDDFLAGDEGDDLLYGGRDDDTLTGGAGKDTLHGEDDHDHLFGRNDGDLMFGGSGNDFLSGDDGNDTLKGGEGNDLLSGGKKSDRLSGNGGDDILYGDTGSDLLVGHNGDDILAASGINYNGQTNAIDYLYSGSGRDVFSFQEYGSYFNFWSGIVLKDRVGFDLAMIEDFELESDSIVLVSDIKQRQPDGQVVDVLKLEYQTFQSITGTDIILKSPYEGIADYFIGSVKGIDKDVFDTQANIIYTDSVIE